MWDQAPAPLGTVAIGLPGRAKGGYGTRSLTLCCFISVSKVVFKGSFLPEAFFLSSINLLSNSSVLPSSQGLNLGVYAPDAYAIQKD